MNKPGHQEATLSVAQKNSPTLESKSVALANSAMCRCLKRNNGQKVWNPYYRTMSKLYLDIIHYRYSIQAIAMVYKRAREEKSQSN